MRIQSIRIITVAIRHQITTTSFSTLNYTSYVSSSVSTAFFSLSQIRPFDKNYSGQVHPILPFSISKPSPSHFVQLFSSHSLQLYPHYLHFPIFLSKKVPLGHVLHSPETEINGALQVQQIFSFLHFWQCFGHLVHPFWEKKVDVGQC